MEVVFSMHPDLVELVTRFELALVVTQGAVNSVNVSLTPQAQETALISGFSLGDVVMIRLQTTVGSGPSATVYFTAFSMVTVSIQTVREYLAVAIS